MTTQVLKIFRETALPGTLQPYSMYVVAPTAKPDYIELYVTNAAGTQAKRIIDSEDIQSMIDTSISLANELLIVDDIAARNLIVPTTTKYVYVKDATGDLTVSSGGATYLYDPIATSWVKVNEAESLDVVVTWASISGKPTSTPAAIDSAVANAHTHANKTQLDKISEDLGGNLTYDNSLPSIGWNSTGW